MKRRPPRLSDEQPFDDWDGFTWARVLGISPKKHEEVDPDYYSDDWPELSKQLREEMDYCCQSCGISLKSNPHLLHVHHIDRNKGNNRRHNLLVVCAFCHSRFPDHAHI